MPGKFWPCPECPFRSTSKRGIQMHWKSRHTPSFPNLVEYSQDLLESVSAEKYRLLATGYESNRMEAEPAGKLIDGFARGSGPSVAPKRSASFPTFGYAPQKLSCRPRSVTTQSEPQSSRFVSESDSIPIPRTRTPECFVLPDSHVHGDQSSGTAQHSYYCASGDGHYVEVRPYTVRESPDESCERAFDLSIGPGPPGNRSVQKAPEQVSSGTFAHRAVRSSQNPSRASSTIDDSEIVNRNITLPHCSLSVLRNEPKSAGRSLLRSLWPSCLLEWVYEQLNGEFAPPRGGNDLGAYRTFLTLLGNCPILDYNAASTWDIVLRCSICGIPMSGVQSMETHIREHLQQVQNSFEVRRRTPEDFAAHTTSGQMNIPTPGPTDSGPPRKSQMSPIISATSGSTSAFSVRAPAEIPTTSMTLDLTAQ